MRVVFVLDYFYDEYKGGAELSMQAHMDTCPFPFVKVKSAKFTPKMVNKDDIIVFGNFALLDKCLLTELAGYKYVVEECDYKYCRHRSSHLHKFMEGKACDCHSDYSAPIVYFMQHAQHLFWKSERQRDEYYRLFPQLKDVKSDIMGGVFTDKQLDFILSLKNNPHDEKYFILKSPSWIKGYRESMMYCIEHELPTREVGNISYNDALTEMSRCKGIVYLPNGYDVSCRMITEMKLMGREIITNNRVQHMTEPWFEGGEQAMVQFLSTRNPTFWKAIHEVASRPA